MPLTYSWSSDSSLVNFSDLTSDTTVVSFEETGTFEITVTVFDGELSDTDSTTFTVLEDRPPVIVDEIDDLAIRGDFSVTFGRYNLSCGPIPISATAIGGMGELDFTWNSFAHNPFATNVVINPTTGTDVEIFTSYSSTRSTPAPNHWAEFIVTASDGFYSNDGKFKLNCNIVG